MELKQILNEDNNFTYKSDKFCLRKLITRYISKIELEQDKEFFTYVGGVNLNFDRNEIGVYKYQNGDIYLGNWNKNLKDGIGIFYSSQNFPGTTNKTFFNMYIGNWTCNAKNGKGIYLRILLNKDIKNNNNESFNNDAVDLKIENNNENPSINNTCNLGQNTFKYKEKLSKIFLINSNHIEKLELFCGMFKDDEYLEGINYFIGVNNEETIYYGKMNENYEKNDTEGIFVTRNNKYIYKGKFVNNKFTDGYVLNANDENSKLIYIEYDDNEIIDFKNKNDIENYDELYYDMVKIFVQFNEVEYFFDVVKYANITDYYITKYINFDFDAFIDNYDFLREHVIYFKELFDNIIDSLSL